VGLKLVPINEKTAAFLCLCRPKEKLTKEKAVMQGYSPRTLGRFLKKAPQKLF